MCWIWRRLLDDPRRSFSVLLRQVFKRALLRSRSSWLLFWLCHWFIIRLVISDPDLFWYRVRRLEMRILIVSRRLLSRLLRSQLIEGACCLFLLGTCTAPSRLGRDRSSRVLCKACTRLSRMEVWYRLLDWECRYLLFGLGLQLCNVLLRRFIPLFDIWFRSVWPRD